MRAAFRFALAVLVALSLADVATWALRHDAVDHVNKLAGVWDLLLAVVAFFVVWRAPRDRVRAIVALGGALAAEELYLLVHVWAESSWRFETDRLWNTEAFLITLACGFGIFLAGRGRARPIDGLLIAVPVIVVDFLLTAVSSLRALGQDFSVGAVTPHLGQMLLWGAVVSVVVPVIGYRVPRDTARSSSRGA